MVSGGMSCVKCLLFCFNLIFAVSGIAILTLGAICLSVYSRYEVFAYESLQSTPFILMIVGVVIFVVAFFGCCGTIKESHCMVSTFAVLLFIILTVEVAAGVVGYVRRNELESMVESKLNTTMYDYHKNTKVRKTWNMAQHELECCGMNGPEDWKKVFYNNSLPHTCCPNTEDNGTCFIKSNHYNESCYQKVKNMIITYSEWILYIGLGIAISQFIGILFACCLARSVSKQYEVV